MKAQKGEGYQELDCVCQFEVPTRHLRRDVEQVVVYASLEYGERSRPEIHMCESQ